MLELLIKQLHDEIAVCRKEAASCSSTESDLYREATNSVYSLNKSINRLTENKEKFAAEMKLIIANYSMGFLSAHECISQIDELLTAMNDDHMQMFLYEYFKRINELIEPIVEEVIEFVSK